MVSVGCFSTKEDFRMKQPNNAKIYNTALYMPIGRSDCNTGTTPSL